MKRNAYFDNAKAILIFLIVCGHVMSNMIDDNELLYKIYLFIYLFHIPAFVLISGFFAKKINNEGYLKKTILKLIIPYILFQFIYNIYYKFVFSDDIVLSMLTPRWALWFLLSLICWNIMLKMFSNVKYGLILSILLSLAIGYESDVNGFFSLSRTFFFFPFFLIGYKIKKETFEKLYSNRKRWLSVVCIFILFLVVYYLVPNEMKDYLLGKRSYETVFIYHLNFAWLERLIVYLLMTVATFIFLSIVPKKEMFFTSVGKNTLTVYIFHMFILRVLQELTIIDYIMATDRYWMIVLIAWFIVYVLSRDVINVFMNRLLDLFKNLITFSYLKRFFSKNTGNL